MVARAPAGCLGGTAGGLARGRGRRPNRWRARDSGRPVLRHADHRGKGVLPAPRRGAPPIWTAGGDAATSARDPPGRGAVAQPAGPGAASRGRHQLSRLHRQRPDQARESRPLRQERGRDAKPASRDSWRCRASRPEGGAADSVAHRRPAAVWGRRDRRGDRADARVCLTAAGYPEQGGARRALSSWTGGDGRLAGHSRTTSSRATRRRPSSLLLALPTRWSGSRR